MTTAIAPLTVTAEPGSSADLLALIRKGGYSLPHVVGSCAMGPHPDDGAVVDSSGRVHGAERLNVADTEYLPVTRRATTQVRNGSSPDSHRIPS